MSYPKVEQPTRIKLGLFPHQLTSIYHMEKAEENDTIEMPPYTLNSNIRIIGDIPGYGKSMSVLGLIARDKMKWDCNERFIVKNIRSTKNMTITIVEKQTHEKMNVNLIIVSPSIIHQWEQYISLTDLTYKVLKTESDVTTTNIKDYEIIVLTPKTYSSFAKKYENICFKRMIYDEPVNNYIQGMEYMYAGFYWFMCASWIEIPMTYYSRKCHMFKDMLSGIGQNVLNKLVIKNPDDYVKSSFKMPTTHEHSYKCVNPLMVTGLKNHVDPHILGMISGGNIKGAILELGGKTTDGNLMEIVKKKHNVKLIEAKAHLSGWNERKKLYINSNQQVPTQTIESITFWEKRVVDIEKNINDLDQKYKNILNEDCSICADEMKNPILVPCCQNIFCGSCIVNWVKSKANCINCRSPLALDKLIYIDDKEKGKGKETAKLPVKQSETTYTKEQMFVKVVREIITKNKNSKIIVFSDYDETFKMLDQILSHENIKYRECKGAVRTREKVLREFKTGVFPILFLNSKYNGAGINIPETTDIIIYHNMPDSTKLQLIGRANRVGREIDLHVHNLIES